MIERFRAVWVAIAVLMAKTAIAYYGCNVDPVDRSNWVESYIIDENCAQMRMRGPDGMQLVLRRDPSDPDGLICPEPWIGERRGKQTIVMTDPDFAGGQTGFLFQDGHLCMLLLDGKEYQVDISDGERDPEPIASDWPTISEADIAAANEKIRVSWDGRFSLWFRNPNRAALLMAEIALVALALMVSGGRFAAGLALPLFVACVWGIVLSASRSGMLALGAGIVWFAVFGRRRIFTAKNIAIALSAFAFLVFIVWHAGYIGRFTSGMFQEGYSDVSRIPIWMKAPSMMVAAPHGWGLGNSGEAYMNWFQPLDRFHMVLALLSSHMTWLVEFGWILRFVYVFLWFAGIGLFALAAAEGRSVLPLALWSAMFVGLTFNHMGRGCSMWVIPVSVSILSLNHQALRFGKRHIAILVVGAVASLAVLCAIYSYGSRNGEAVCVKRSGPHLTINNGNPVDWIVDDGFVLDGGYHGLLGKGIREWCMQHRQFKPLGCVRSPKDIPPDARKVLFAGKSGEEFVRMWKDDSSVRDTAGFQIIFLSPPFSWREVPEDMIGHGKVQFITGEFAYRRIDGESNYPNWVCVKKGCSLYIPDWMQYICDDVPSKQ